jgi:DNA-binding NarL/FixJ family response regulator
MGKISVLLADDHALVRQGLKALLTAEPDMEVVGEAKNGQEAVALARKIHPEVILMDLAMPMMNGLTATTQILKASPQTKVLVLSSYSDDKCVHDMFQAGATGFLMKATASNELAQAVRDARRGNRVLSSSIARRFQNKRFGEFIEHGNAQKTSELTPREIEVLKQIAEGLSNREIGEALKISIKTVEKHRQQVMNKLDIHEVAGLTRFALANNLVKREAPQPMLGA